MEVPLLLFVGLILLLACSAFTSASEIAFFALSLNDLEELKKSNKKNDKVILQLREKPDYLLSTLLIFNNLVNVSIVIVASELLYCILGVNIDEVVKFLIDTVLITFIVLLFGENMPKIYASSNPLQFARKAALPLSILGKILYPISWLLVKPTSRVKRLEKHANTSVSMDELSQAFELTSNEIKEDKEILEGIIKFGNINTVGAMTPRVDVVAISDTASFKEVIDLIINAGYSRIPVYQENIDEIRGILYVKDLLPHIDKPDFDWRTLIRKPFFVPQTKHINTLLEEFQQNKTHIAVVVDEFGGTAGIITMEDILEEIVGEITDEYDEDEGRMYVQINENTYLFEAKILLNDFFKIKGIQRADFEDSIGEAETLAGLILELKGEIPDQETEIDFKQYKFTIVSSDKRRIKSIKLSIENQQLEKDK